MVIVALENIIELAAVCVATARLFRLENRLFDFVFFTNFKSLLYSFFHELFEKIAC